MLTGWGVYVLMPYNCYFPMLIDDQSCRDDGQAHTAKDNTLIQHSFNIQSFDRCGKGFVGSHKKKIAR